jgi:hypothetical protein
VAVITNKLIFRIKEVVPGIPRVGLIIAAFLLVLVSMILLHQWSQSRNSVSPIEILFGAPPAPARDARVFSQDDVTIYMPSDATELDGTLFIAVAGPNLSLVLDDIRWFLLRVATVEFRSPDGRTLSGVSFSAPVEICFQLTEEQWQAYTEKPDSYRVQYYADLMSPPRWEALPQSTYPDRFQLCGQTHDLSVFGLAVQAQPGIPVTGLIAALPPTAASQPAQARDRRGTNYSSDTSALQVIPSAAPTQLQPTDPPPAEPRVTEPSPASPAVTDEQKEEQKAEDKQQKEEEKAQEKQQKEEDKAQDKQQKEEDKANGQDKKDKEKK